MTNKRPAGPMTDPSYDTMMQKFEFLHTTVLIHVKESVTFKLDLALNL
jgi:hypothetical protein